MLPLMVWVIVLVAAAIVGYLALRGLDWAWGTPPLPPPLPPPQITSAVGTSAKTVHLTLSQGTGQVQLERFRPDIASSFAFFAPLNPAGVTHVDDTFGLRPDKSYIYRARRTAPANSSWSDPPQQGKEAHTLGIALDPGQLFSVSNGWAGYCLVQRFEPNVLSRSGELVSITIRASSVGLSIDWIYISQADLAVGTDPYDSVEERKAMHEILFNHPPLVISSTEAYLPKTLPAIPYTLDHTKPLLIAIEFSATPASGIMYTEVPPGEAVAYFKLQGPLQEQEQPEAMKTDRSGYTRFPGDATKGGIYLIERIDVG